MPERDPNTWASVPAVIAHAWELLPEPIKAGIMSMGIALLRVLYDDKEPRWLRRFLESALCGAIAVLVALIVTAFGLDEKIASAAGGMVGFFGVEEVRDFARRFAAKRLDGKH